MNILVYVSNAKSWFNILSVGSLFLTSFYAISVNLFLQSINYFFVQDIYRFQHIWMKKHVWTSSKFIIFYWKLQARCHSNVFLNENFSWMNLDLLLFLYPLYTYNGFRSILDFQWFDRMDSQYTQIIKHIFKIAKKKVDKSRKGNSSWQTVYIAFWKLAPWDSIIPYWFSVQIID